MHNTTIYIIIIHDTNITVCIMIKHNINARSFGSHARGKKRVKLDKEQVASMYESGMSQSKIGKALGVSNAWISKLMKRYDIKARKTGRACPKIRSN